MENLIKLLRNHDWYFEYSDDHKVWQRGVMQRADMAAFRRMLEADSDKAMKLYRHVLDRHHDAGPEADYIIRLWKQERGINAKNDSNS